MKDNKALTGNWKRTGNWLALVMAFMLLVLVLSVSAANESRVINPGETNASIFLLLKVDYWNSTTLAWEPEFTTIDDDAGRFIQGNFSYIALDQFFNGKYNTSENFTHGDGTYRVYAAVTDPDNNVLQNMDGSYLEAEYNFTISENLAPEHDAPILNATDYPLNRTKANLTCYNQSTTDSPGDVVTNIYRWYKDDVVQSALENNSVVESVNTAKGQVWVCEVTPTDGWLEGVPKNSTALTILNTPPPKVVLLAPGDDSFGYEFRPTFNWSAAVDDDGDDVTYNLHLVRTGCYGLSACQNPDVDVEGILGVSYTIGEDLDLDSPYNWTVIANDSLGYGEESDAWNYTVMSLIDIGLVHDTVAVGGLEPGDTASTELDSPLPFVVENKGNVHINLTVYASVQLWELAPLGTNYFMFMAGESSKPGSFNMSLSASDWVNLTGSAQFAVAELDYDDAKDYAEIEIAIEVPHSEPPGTKSTSIIIEAVGTKV